MKIALAQFKFSLGNFKQNEKLVLEGLKKAKGQADLIVFPEGGLWAYPPKDFLYQDRHFQTQENSFRKIKKHLPASMGLVLPGFFKNKNLIQNGVYFFAKNKQTRFFAKEFLPDQGVFFESRYFTKGESKNNFFYWKKKKIQILICEDLWKVSPKNQADLLITVNASPYTDQIQKKRLARIKQLVKLYNCPAVYLNLIGGQDSLIFDGGSFCLNQKSHLVWQGAFFQPDFQILNLNQTKTLTSKTKTFLSLQKQRELALVLGIKDFFHQTGFKKAIIGLSGGIDSALTTYLAVQALGKKNVKVFFLPGPYTEKLSWEITKEQTEKLNIPLKEINITSLLKIFSKNLGNKNIKSHPIAFQNIQARLRALILMTEANVSSCLLLATGNKSELATGYSTLYGDLAGALSPIGDLLKSEVYDLAHFINKEKQVFPKKVLSREPSAELAPNQKDKNDLLPYDKLDPLLKRILQNQDITSITEKNLAKRIQEQEFKRAQAPPILKISEYDLGAGWQKPIAHNFLF